MPEKNYVDLWHHLLKLLHGHISQNDISTHLSLLEPTGYEQNHLILNAMNPYALQTVNNRYLAIMNQVFAQADLGDGIKITCKTRSVPIQQIPRASEAPSTPTMPQINSTYRFDTFVVGKSNQMAYNACYGASRLSGHYQRFNPLFIYGDSGLGKTHLMHSIVHAMREQNPSFNVCYLSAERFTNEMILALKNNSIQNFRDKYRHVDALLIDDIQFLSGKEGTQEEFFHTFNDLNEAGKQIVISNDRPPSEIQDVQTRLVSRFSMGLVVDISRPDYETRCAILKKKAELRNYFIPSEIIEWIANHTNGSNIRELEGNLNTVIMNAELGGIPLTVEHVKEILRKHNSTLRKGPITIETIQNQISMQSGIPLEELLSRKRTNELATWRHIAMYLCDTYTETSKVNIAKAFCRKDHTTVIHGINKIHNELKENIRIQEIVKKAEEKLCITEEKSE